MDRKDEEFLKRLLLTFKIEALEHLGVISSGLVVIEKGDPLKQEEIIETVYRESHSMKGAARSVDLNDIVAICQSMEDVFSALKRKVIVPSSNVLDLLYKTIDVTGKLVAGEESTESEVRDLIHELGSVTRLKQSGLATAAGKQAVPRISPESLSTHVRAPAAAGTIRISAAKLDSLLLQAEEMLSVKISAGQRAADLGEFKKEFELWKKTGLADQAPVLETALANLVKAAESDRRSFGAMVDNLLDDMKQALMLPFSYLLEVLPGLVRNLSREAGKEADFTTHGEELEIDRRVLEEIKDPLIHLVRNCIDHGIEMPYVRAKKKKPRAGNIEITVSSRDSRIEIAVSDDGAGIDTPAVKAAAEKKGSISRDEAGGLSRHEALLLVFRSGITTSPIITDISGRGLGLAIVREKVEKLNGTIEIDSQPDMGTTIRMIVPLTLATFRGVLVRVNEHLFILPAANVQRVARVRKEEIRTVENRETLSFDGQPVSLVRLGDLLGLKTGSRSQPAGTDGPFAQVVVLGSAEKRMAFLTDEVLHEQEVLVKPLGRQLSRVRNISGATVLGTGRVVPVLNVPDLMKSAVKAAPAVSAGVVEGPGKRISVLVAEDSITARTMLKTILESSGYDVETAVDGVDAFTQLKSSEFDLVVSDVDMPRMNGFDLTEKIRADRKLSELPVVLVTALESREDRERGIDAGASAYIVKSSFDQSNLLKVVKRLI